MTKTAVSLSGRDILDLSSLSVEEYDLIMRTAAEMKKVMKRDIKKLPSLQGQIHREPVLRKQHPDPKLL